MELREDDYASLLAGAEEKLSRQDIAAVLGVDERRLDDIASGYVPDAETAKRLRDLAASDPERVTTSSRRTLIAAFVAMDLVFFAGLATFLFLR